MTEENNIQSKKSKVKLYGTVSEDYVNMIADKAPDMLRSKSSGEVLIDPTLVALGFHYDMTTKSALYTTLTKGVNRKEMGSYNIDEVYVRNPSMPHQVRQMTVYSGLIREDYLYKGIYLDGSDSEEGCLGCVVKVGDFTVGSDIQNILDIGEEKYYSDGWNATVKMEGMGVGNKVLYSENDGNSVCED